MPSRNIRRLFVFLAAPCLSIAVLIGCCFFPSSHGWTFSNSLYGPQSIHYGFRNFTDKRIEITIPNIIYKYDNRPLDLNLKKKDLEFQCFKHPGYYSSHISFTTRSLYRVNKGQELTCRVDVYKDNKDEDIDISNVYKIKINYPDGFWDKGSSPFIEFFYDGEQLWISFQDLHNRYFKSCLNDGTPFLLRDYLFYGWFYPDITVKDYLKLPENIRCFSQEEIEKITSIINDLKEQYIATSSLIERKEIRRKIAEKLKQEYPIR